MRRAVAWWRARRAFAATVAFVVVASGVVAASPRAAAGDPVPGTWFEYDYNTYVDSGTGAYEGYSDRMRSHSRYEVRAVAGDNVTVHADGSWTFEGSDGATDAGTLNLTFTFSIASRRYLGLIDLDPPHVDPRVWFWIPTPVEVGRIVPIAEDLFEVESLDAVAWQGLIPRSTVRLTSAGTYARNDAYGTFWAEYRDAYHFDGTTGFLVAEYFEETDVGSWEGQAASFRFRAEVLVTSSSYSAPIHLPSFLAVDVGVLLLLVAVAYAVSRRWPHRRGPRHVTVREDGRRMRATLRRVRRASGLEGLGPDGSRFFGPFLPAFAGRAIASGDPVVLASAEGRIAGLLTHDGESGVSSLFASSEPVARGLARWLRGREYFAEVPDGARLPDPVVDTFHVLELADVRFVDYDPEVVRPMAADDLPAVIAIAETVYAGRARRWIRACFEEGDLAFVAMADNRVVGFGFATVVGDAARLHTLTVLPPYRARGLGSEIMAARLSALSALGVRRALVEISKHNAASLRVAYRAGFAKVGDTTYHSRRPKAAAPMWGRQF